MTTITRENAEIKSFITGFLSDPAHDNQSSNSLLADVFRIALASLEAVSDERAAYELFMEKRFGESVDRRRAKNGDSEYMAWDMALGWIIWCHRATMLQSQGEGNPHVTPARLPGGFTIEDAKELHEDLVRSHISQALSGEKMKKNDRDADLRWIHGVIVQAAWFVKASLDALPEPLREEKGGSANCTASHGTTDNPPVPGKQTDELTMLVKQLVSQLKKVKPDCKLPDKAMDYLKRNELISAEDVLR
ncbi:hypothetical protein HEO25_011275 [Escherichia coli]|nr:hypothetical protein [Escherichia coli]EIH9716238.1 hypothetical protein [Escherichia coli]MBB6761658.1 hypothetical protein [Escherichia coli]NJZ65655.1 hypothetical protein [Escherichia coli]OJK59895.1 hypothetical protein BK246_21505 [Escherichia coli]